MSTRRPVIGISSYIEPAAWGVWRNVPAALVPHRYVRHVQNAGGVAVVLPPLAEPVIDEAFVVLERLDGLMLAGGVDVQPSRYGEEPQATVQEPRPERDASELALVQRAVEMDLPLLGICRGMQVLAVAAGGSLVQHLPDKIGTADHSPGPASYGQTTVNIESDSRLAAVLGERVDVSCYHHQGVAAHPGYESTGWASDGTLEAIEALDARWRVGVQWHPEVGTDPRLFEALVGAAARA
ncbi:MAG: gamma-glutamyl-gamma-aminobutyrate hydrolase family protein [Geodermatophilaceae bacterium]|nr:gamma-glutamyl-gamma-aminobutyrate hydrolase family protein [Geodermatophilaceae bacterium]